MQTIENSMVSGDWWGKDPQERTGCQSPSWDEMRKECEDQLAEISPDLFGRQGVFGDVEELADSLYGDYPCDEEDLGEILRELTDLRRKNGGKNHD